MFWIDMTNPNEAEEETILISLFDVHPLTIEDCRKGLEEEQHLPKVEDFGENLFVIFNPLSSDCVNGKIPASGRRVIDVRTSQLSAYLFKHILITHHYQPLEAITGTEELCKKNP